MTHSTRSYFDTLELIAMMGLMFLACAAIVLGLVGAFIGVTAGPFVVVMWAYTVLFTVPSASKPCIDGVVVLDPHAYTISGVDTAVACGGNRIPGMPETRDGLLVINCACPVKEGDAQHLNDLRLEVR